MRWANIIKKREGGVAMEKHGKPSLKKHGD
jgi:hypothetical protein